MTIDPRQIPGLVRLIDRAGVDQLAVKSRSGWWVHEEPFPEVVAAVTQGQEAAFYDVGANTGYYSVLVGKLAPAATIRSFEPVESIAAILTQNLTLNRIDAQVHTLALSDSAGSATIHFPPGNHGKIEASASLDPEFNRERTNARTDTVVTSTVDLVNAEADGEAVGFIKIDVEGLEHIVLRGASTVLRRDRPVVSIEVLPQVAAGEIETLMAEDDFALLSLRPGPDVREESRVAFLNESRNQLLVPRERLDDVQARIAHFCTPPRSPIAADWSGSDTERLLLQLQIEQEARLIEAGFTAEREREIQEFHSSPRLVARRAMQSLRRRMGKVG